MQKKTSFTLKEITAKLEYYCAYQERCYKEVEEKLFDFFLNDDEKNQILTHLIENNYINEERFVRSFVRGKHNYKLWGKVRISNELKFRNITSKLIEIGLTEIDNTAYFETFNTLAEKTWDNIKEREGMKKNKKFVDFLIRKGYETHLVFDKLNELSKK